MVAMNGASEPTKIFNKSFICIMVTNFMHCMGHASVNPLVASYMKYLNTGAQLAGFLTGMFFGVSLIMRPFAGPVVAKFDKRKLLMFVYLVGAVANLGYAMFHSVSAFMAFRFLSGVQYSLVGSLNMTLAGDHLPKKKLASGLGIYGIGGAIGNAIAPSIGEAILRSGTNLRGESFGFTLMFLFGALNLALAVIPAIVLSPDRKTKKDVESIGAWYKNIATKHAVPPTIALLLLMMAYSLINTYMFEFGKEQGIGNINVFYLVIAASLALSRPMSGFLTDKLGMNRIIFPALAIFALSMFVIGSSTILWVLLVGGVLAAIGFGSSQPAIQAMSMQSETPQRRAVATNTIYFGIDLGLFLGPYLGGIVYGWSDYSVMYKVGAAPVCLALVCFVLIIPMHRRRQRELGA